MELVGALFPDAVDLLAVVCEARRSVKRLVVPRIAPRLDAGAPGAPAVADCAFNAVFVLVVDVSWRVPVPVEPEDDDDDPELDAAGAELVADDPVPTAFVPLAP